MIRTFRILPAVFALAFAAGIGIRIAGHKPLLSADMVYRAAGEVTFPGTKTPKDTAVSFYMYIDRGMYEEAYAVSLEPDFTLDDKLSSFKERVAGGPENFQGFTAEEEFVSRLNFELGRNGYWIKLNNIRAAAAEAACIIPEWTREELTAAHGADSGLFEECYPVQVTGHLLGACTIFSWKKVIPVVETAEGYKVLLPGTKRERQFYYQDWIMNITKIFDLRATDQM